MEIGKIFYNLYVYRIFDNIIERLILILFDCSILGFTGLRGGKRLAIEKNLLRYFFLYRKEILIIEDIDKIKKSKLK